MLSGHGQRGCGARRARTGGVRLSGQTVRHRHPGRPRCTRPGGGPTFPDAEEERRVGDVMIPLADYTSVAKGRHRRRGDRPAPQILRRLGGKRQHHGDRSPLAAGDSGPTARLKAWWPSPISWGDHAALPVCAQADSRRLRSSTRRCSGSACSRVKSHSCGRSASARSCPRCRPTSPPTPRSWRPPT